MSHYKHTSLESTHTEETTQSPMTSEEPAQARRTLFEMLGTETHDEMPPVTQLNAFPWEALGWSSAAELGWAPGMEGAHGKRAVLQRDSCAQEQLLCKAQQG